MEELDATVDIVREGGKEGIELGMKVDWQDGGKEGGGEDGNWVEAEGRKTGRTEKGKLRKEVDG